MKKMTKKEKVEAYLGTLMKAEGFIIESLMNMTVYDLFGNAELEGIGKTTLSGALNSFKKKFGLKKSGKGGLVPVKNTKKERVERYLTDLMKSPDFNVDDLLNLTVYDLFGNAELEGIGKTTLSSGISSFKKKYLKIQYTNNIEAEPGFEVESEAEVETEQEEEVAKTEVETETEVEVEEEEDEDTESTEDDDSFEDVFLNAIEKEEKKDLKPDASEDGIKKKKRGRKKKEISDNVEAIKIGGASKVIKMEETPDGMDETKTDLSKKDVNTLKMLIEYFRNGSLSFMQAEHLELVELKQALEAFGIDYKVIVEQYKKNSGIK